MSSLEFNGKKYAKGAIFVYIVVFLKVYEIWMNPRQADLYQIDRVFGSEICHFESKAPKHSTNQ